MNSLSKLRLVLIGAVGATLFHFSCDDGGPSAPVDAAAAVCDCPVAEPPLEARFVNKSASFEIAPMVGGGESIACDIGSRVISGGCESKSTSPSITLNSSFGSPGAKPIGWGCYFYNGTASPAMFEVHVLCLTPAP